MIKKVFKLIDIHLRILRGKIYKKYNINVINNFETLEYIKRTSCSVIRFGDGEFDIIRGENIPYQNYNEKLASQMKSLILNTNKTGVLVCLPDVFHDLNRYTAKSNNFYYVSFFYQNRKILKEIEKGNKVYGSTFISRPYIDLRDKSKSMKYFNELKKLWANKDILIVEGKYSRSGENNDLFANCRSIKRIICPSKNAYSKIIEIESIIKNVAGNRLILMMLGPTAKIVIADLSNSMENQFIDLGHIDSEYEWFKMGAIEKTRIFNKHTAEFNNADDSVVLPNDKTFDEQIIKDIS